jgi:copper resistance protein B
MKADQQLLLPAVIAFLVCAPTLFAQPGASATSGASSSASQSAGQQRTPENLESQKDWPSPVGDSERRTFIFVDVLEYRPKPSDSDFRWDVEGWHGGDLNRLWFKSEGERNTALKADYDIDGQLLYGRFLRKYYDFQAGVRAETQIYQGRNVSRAHAVIGVEGLVPYNYEIETALFISQSGDVSGRFSLTKDFRVTQRWVVQSRFETAMAAQRVERFTTGSGLNNLEYGLRLRYDISRKFSPYAGISFDRAFFGTADLIRQEGGDPSQIRFVVGVRMWR